MTWSRMLAGAGLLLLLLAPLAAGTAHADRHRFEGVGLVLLADVTALGDGLVYDIDGVAPLPADRAYEGWLVNSATGARVSTGVMAVEDGAIDHAWRAPGAANVLGLGYDTVEISLEPVPDDGAEPSEVVYSYTHPAALLLHVQHLISHGLAEGAHVHGPGDPDRPGLLIAIRDDLQLAIGAANEAMAAEDLDGFREAARRLLALDELLLAEEAAIHTELLAGAHGPGIDVFAAQVDYMAAIAEARTLRVRGQTQAALAADSLEEGKAALSGAAASLISARGGIVQAYGWAQRIATFPVPGVLPAQAGAGAATAAPGAPATGNAGLAAPGASAPVAPGAGLLAASALLLGAAALTARRRIAAGA